MKVLAVFVFALAVGSISAQDPTVNTTKPSDPAAPSADTNGADQSTDTNVYEKLFALLTGSGLGKSTATQYSQQLANYLPGGDLSKSGKEDDLICVIGKVLRDIAAVYTGLAILQLLNPQILAIVSLLSFLNGFPIVGTVLLSLILLGQGLVSTPIFIIDTAAKATFVTGLTLLGNTLLANCKKS